MYGLARLFLVLPLFTTTVKGTELEILKLTRSMTLSCVYPGPSQIEQATWSKKTDSQKEVIAVFNNEYGTHIYERFKGRVAFVNTASDSKSKSLFFNWTLPSDLGLYSCTVQAFPEGSWEKKIKVAQTDLGLSDKEVVISPSVNLPTSHFKDKSKEESLLRNQKKDQFEETTPLLSSYTLGHNTTMACPCTLGSVVKQLTWEKIGAEKQTAIGWCNMSKGQVMQGYGSDYKYRSHIDCGNSQNSSLTLWNTTASDEGLYRCHFATDTGNQTTTISLSIAGGHPAYSLAVFTIGAAVLFIVLVFTVAIIVIVCCMHKKKKERERKRSMVKFNVRHPNQTRPFNSYGGGHSITDNRRGKNNRHGATVTVIQEESIYVNCRNFA